MERFVKGDVVILPFPYTDSSGTKKRPALVIANIKGDSIILAQITTKKRDDKDLINLTKADFYSGSLKHDSFIMTSIIFTADQSKINYKAGQLTQDKIKQVEKQLCEIFTR